MIFLWSVSFEMPNQLLWAMALFCLPTPVIISTSLRPATSELTLLVGEDQMHGSALVSARPAAAYPGPGDVF